MTAENVMMIDSIHAISQDAIARLVVDIETGECDEPDLELERSILKPAGNIKSEEKKAENLKKKQEAVEDNDGKLDSNPIACIGVEADGALWHFSTFEFSEEEYAKLSRAGVKVKTAENEADMLKKFKQFCDQQCDEGTRVIAWNGKGFDSRRIRFAYSRNHITHPEIFAPYSRNWHVDLMFEFGDKFTVNNALKKMSSLETACKFFKIAYSKGIKGADIPAAVTAKRFFEVTKANLSDVRETSEVGALMGF